MKLTLKQWNCIHWLLKQEEEKRQEEYTTVRAAYQRLNPSLSDWEIGKIEHVNRMSDRWREVVNILDKLETGDF